MNTAYSQCAEKNDANKHVQRTHRRNYSIKRLKAFAATAVAIRLFGIVWISDNSARIPLHTHTLDSPLAISNEWHIVLWYMSMVNRPSLFLCWTATARMANVCNAKCAQFETSASCWIVWNKLSECSDTKIHTRNTNQLKTNRKKTHIQKKERRRKFKGILTANFWRRTVDTASAESKWLNLSIPPSSKRQIWNSTETNDSFRTKMATIESNKSRIFQNTSQMSLCGGYVGHLANPFRI